MEMNIKQRTEAVLDEYHDALNLIDESAFEVFVTEIAKQKRIFVLAAGRSRCVMQMFAMRLVQAGIETHMVGNVTTPAIEEGEMLIVASGSGSTKGVLALADNGIKAGASLFVITASLKSPLAKKASKVLHIPTSSLTNTQLLGTYFETTMLLTTDLLLDELLKMQGLFAEDLAGRHANIE